MVAQIVAGMVKLFNEPSSNVDSYSLKISGKNN